MFVYFIHKGSIKSLTHISFCLRPDSSKIFCKGSVIVRPFLSFEGTTQTYLLEISVSSYIKRIPLLYLLNNCISAKSALQILSIKSECTFCFSNFLIIGLCNSLANSLLGVIVIVLPKIFLSKKC